LEAVSEYAPHLPHGFTHMGFSPDPGTTTLAIGRATVRLYSWGCGMFPGGGNDGSVPALGQGLEGVGDVLDVGNPPKAVMGRLGSVLERGGAEKRQEKRQDKRQERGQPMWPSRPPGVRTTASC
jgi:hypothetical protein